MSHQTPLDFRLVKASLFACSSNEEVYQVIMQWGRSLPPFQSAWKISTNLVIGCQSVMYLHTTYLEGKVYFSAASDALISAGLAAILIALYDGQTPETILQTPPTILDELGITASLTPGRANGLASLYLKMKQEAVMYLTSKVGSAQT